MPEGAVRARPLPGRRAILAFLLLAAAPLDAQCRLATTGAACVTVPDREAFQYPDPGPVEIGATLPRDTWPTIWETEHYGLPRPDGRWTYVRVEDDLYRVDWQTMEVLERVTHRMRRTFPDVAAALPPVEPRVIDRFGRESGLAGREGSGRHVVTVEPVEPPEEQIGR